MRYDDMIRTVVDQPLATPSARATAWVQLVDLVAQGRGGAAIDRVYDFLRAARSDVPMEVRLRAARMLAGRQMPPGLILLFAEDSAPIAAPVLGTARLAGGNWATLLPELSPTTRGFLRNRRDLDEDTQRALAAFGPVDLVLDAPAAATLPAQAVPAMLSSSAMADEAPVGVSIGDLVKRIEAYRREQPSAVPVADLEPVTEFRFEAASDGVIFWVEGAPREAIIGETLAQAAAADAGHGVDGHVAGAYRRRSAFRDARMAIGGAGPAAGDWRISAVPLFAPHDGRFVGYRGTARRPRPDEMPTPPRRAVALLGTGVAPDSLRQLVHELRTPLNAIVGFADMIEGQLLGPVASEYRVRAGAISTDGQRLLGAVDDLDMAAQLDGAQVRIADGRIDAGLLLSEIASRHDPRSAYDPRIDLIIADDLGWQAGDPVLYDRMLSRLIAAAIGLAEPTERIAVRLEADGAGGLIFTVARPRRLATRDERTLLDPGYAPDGDWPDAPLLGLGFSLRLVRNLATLAGGGLTIEDSQFRLNLPQTVSNSGAGKG